MPFTDPLAPRSDEITKAKTWMAANLGPDEMLTPFSFHYDGEGLERWANNMERRSGYDAPRQSSNPAHPHLL